MKNDFITHITYVQYKNTRNIIETGKVIMVQDFAQNYLWDLQNEPHANHWLHKLATIHQTVVHYRCKTDCYPVTHKVIHVSNDLKHDTHIDKQFHTITMHVLKQHNVRVYKLIKFSNQVPSQYKNKTSFDYLTETYLPTMYCFWCKTVMHAKEV